MNLSNDNQKKYLKKFIINSTVMLGAFIASRGFDTGYKAISGNQVPKNPNDEDTGWAKALVWGMTTGALLGIVKILLKPGVSSGVNKLLND